MLERIKETAAFIQARIENFQPEVGIILGTGLGDFADRIDEKYSIDYKEIPNFPVSTVEGHKGKLIFGLLEGRRVVAMQGRFHYYEGYTMQQVTFPVRVLKLLGVQNIVNGIIQYNVKMDSVLGASQNDIFRWEFRELGHDLLRPHSHKPRRHRRNKKNIRNLHQPADPTFCLLRGNLPAVQLGIVIEFFDH